jgi:CheY-like chemotaxis protein
MEAIGTLAGGIAHDFNNILTAISGHGSLLRMDLGEHDPLRAEVDEILLSAERAARLTQGLLAFSRKQIISPRPIDLNGVVIGMGRLLRRLIGEDIELTTTLSSERLTVLADGGQLEQVIMNLAANARDAMPRGGVLTMRTERRDLPGPGGATHPTLGPGRYAVLSMTDDGEGMDEATRRRIFEPFFTTKALGKGTGLGLSTVYGIVKQSGGDVVAQSSSRGARFTVYLPALPAAETVALEKEPEGVDAPSGGTVLLVEDDNAVREFTAEALRGAGWTVLLASGPADALAIAARESQRIDLLLTDVVMPGMSGGTLADKLAALRPGLRVLFVSGYSEEDVMGRGGLAPGRAMLEKPFTPTELRRRVRQLLQTTG